MATTGRLSRLPMLYPAGIGIAFVLLMLDASGVSVFAGLRTLVVIGLVTYLVTAALTLLLGDRHPAALVTLVLLLAVLVLENPLLVALVLVTAVALVAAALLSRVRPVRIRWAMISRVLTVLTAIMLLAVGIRSVQDGRAAQALGDLASEGPFRTARASAAVSAQDPDVYLILLDGYPRADKLQAEFGIDDSGFIDALTRAGFSVASHSRSNYLQTQLTLMSMFNGELVPATGRELTSAEIHPAINEARAWQPFVERGYQTVSIPSDFEVVAMRRVDRFLDTGQLNEFERVLIQSTVFPVVNGIAPGLLARQHGDRVAASLDRLEALAAEAGPARLVFAHIASPHAPVLFTADGTQLTETATYDIYDDREQSEHLGTQSYVTRLREQLDYLNARVLRVLDAIDRSGRPSVVVVFSDHGSGVRYSEDAELESDIDLRTANLLAVRGIGPIDDRSTLVNLLPLVAHQLFGTPTSPVPEEIRVLTGGSETTWKRPD